MRTYKSLAVLLKAGKYTVKEGRYCAPHQISKPTPGLSTYSTPQRLREMRCLGLCKSEYIGRVVGFALTAKGIKLAEKKDIKK